MRRKQRKRQKPFRDVLQNALSLVSHMIAIVGTILAVIDLIHHW